MNIILRRRNLGRTSCRGIKENSTTGIKIVKTWKQRIPTEVQKVFRWGCTSEIPEGVEVFNKADKISGVSDKAAFRRVLNEKELCPRTWFTAHEAWESGCRDFVVRPRMHSRGRRIYRCTTQMDLMDACVRCGEGFYISEYIDKVSEYRIFFANNRAVWVANKIPGNRNDLAWNVARGGKFENVSWDEWPLKAIKTALEAHKLSGLDFSGVDVMMGADRKCYVLEINSAPSQTSPYRQQCVSKVFDYMVQHGKDSIPMIEDKGGYKKFIHPAICRNAIVRRA